MNIRISDKILYLKEYNMLASLICDYDGDDKALFYWKSFCEELVKSDAFITLLKSNNSYDYVRGEFEHFIEVMRIIVPTFNINFPSMKEAYRAYEEYKVGYFSSANYSEYIRPIDWKQDPYNYFIYVEGRRMMRDKETIIEKNIHHIYNAYSQIYRRIPGIL